MLNFLSVLMVLIFILTSCSNIEEPVLEQTEEEKSESSSAQSEEEPENGFSLDDIDTMQYDEIKEYDIMYVLTKTDGTRLGLVHDENYFSSLGEVPNKKIWLILKNGEFIDEEPFDDLFYYGVASIYAPEKYSFSACRDGSRYDFEVNGNTLEIEGEGVSPALSTKIFDFSLNTYYWTARFPSHGITAADGTVICEPHYKRLSIPFHNRLLAADKASDIFADSHCIIFDEKGKVVNSSYNHIEFSVLPEGYIGVAFCGDPGTPYQYEFYQCHDYDGTPMPYGYWLIDKDGNPISERFDFLYINKEWQLSATSKDDIIYATTEDGEEITFTVESVLIKE